jgi:hypothetical protein
MRKFFGKLISLVLLVIAVALVSLVGYFYYKSSQPMQVEEAQRLAPGITYREFWADRVKHWKEIDDKKVAAGKGRACVLSGYIMSATWIYPGSIINVTRVHNHPNTNRSKMIIEGVQGIMPPDDILYGSIWKLPDAWWWEIENMTWYYFYRPTAREWNCEVGTPKK